MSLIATKLEQSLGIKKRYRKPKAPPVFGPGRPDAYKLSGGKRVPSVTTITGRFKDSAGLIRWSYNQGLEGKPWVEETRDAAGHVGHLVHDRVQKRFQGQEVSEPFEDPDSISAADASEAAFNAWKGSVDFHLLETEQPLVSEKYGFGGTFDMLALVFGVLYLIDLKTGNRVYVEHLIQLAAYRQLLRERDGRRAPRHAMAIRLDKETGQPKVTEFPSEALDLGWEYFRLCRRLYGLDASLRKMVDT